MTVHHKQPRPPRRPETVSAPLRRFTRPLQSRSSWELREVPSGASGLSASDETVCPADEPQVTGTSHPCPLAFAKGRDDPGELSRDLVLVRQPLGAAELCPAHGPPARVACHVAPPKCWCVASQGTGGLGCARNPESGRSLPGVPSRLSPPAPRGVCRGAPPLPGPDTTGEAPRRAAGRCSPRGVPGSGGQSWCCGPAAPQSLRGATHRRGARLAGCGATGSPGQPCSSARTGFVDSVSTPSFPL